MEVIVLYTKYADDVRFLAVYTDTGYAIERRFDFKPIKIGKPLEEILRFFKESKVFFGRAVKVTFKHRYDEQKLSRAIKKLIESEGDEVALFKLAGM